MVPIQLVFDEPYDGHSRRLGPSEVPQLSAGGLSVALALCGPRFMAPVGTLGRKEEVATIRG